MNCVILGPTIEEIKESGKITDIDAYVHEAAHFLAHVFEEVFIIPYYCMGNVIVNLIIEEYKKLSPKAKVTVTDTVKVSNNIICFGSSFDVFEPLGVLRFLTPFDLFPHPKVFVDERYIIEGKPSKEMEHDYSINYFNDFHVLAGQVR